MKDGAMSYHARDKVVDCLSSGQGAKLLNVKFFRGARDIITAEELRAEVASIEAQKLTKAAVASKEAPRSAQPLVDLREFAANI